jgi:hypothetical protein
MTPPMTQASRVNSVVTTRWATSAGFRKMPAPMIPPMTIMTPEKRPMRRA